MKGILSGGSSDRGAGVRAAGTRWLPAVASMLVVAALIAVVVLPIWINRRIEAIRTEIDWVIEPARIAIRDQIEGAMQESGAIRRFLADGDPRMLLRAEEQHRRARNAAELNRQLLRELPPEFAEMHRRVEAAADRWHALHDEFSSGVLTRQEYLARFPEQQARVEALTREADILDRALAAESSRRRSDIARRADQLLVSIAALAGVALLASLAVAWMSWRERKLGKALEAARDDAERQAREQAALRQVVRALGASVSFREVVLRAAEGAVSLTRAHGAYVEKFDSPEPGSEVEIVAVAGGGTPLLGTRAPYPGSLSEELIRSGDSRAMVEVAMVGERMAPYLVTSCPSCRALIVPLASGGEVLGALALLRRHQEGTFSKEECNLARALGDAISAALRRVLLLEDIDRERRSRNALLESIDEGILGVDYRGKVTLANRAASRILGLETREMRGRSVHELLHHHRPGGEPYPEEECPLADVIRGGEGLRSESELLFRGDGSSFPAEHSVQPIEQDDAFVGAVIAFHDITERKRQEQERELLIERQQEACELAESAVRARDDLLSAVSHDLRNPVGTILLGSETLAKSLPSDDSGASARRKVEAIHQAAKNMDRMIRDLLDVDRIETGRLVVEKIPVPVAGVLDEACTLLGPHAERAGITFLCRTSPGLPRVYADPVRLQQILSNLIDNAIKFTPGGGTITIEASRVESGVSISVSDTGRGIGPEELPHLFDRHWQASRSDRRGLGLGLTIVKGLVEAHEGTIEVETAPGQGSTFGFTLPTAEH